MILWFSKFCVRLFSTCFYRHKIYGQEHFPKGGAIVAPNHCSFLDPPLLGISCPGIVLFLARHTLFESTFFGWLLRQLNTHPVKRGKGNIQIFKMAMDFIEKGEKVVIFPEGHRSKDGTLQPAQSGVAMLVLRSRAVVIPVYVYGTYDAWSPHRKLPKLKGQTAVIFGSPVHFDYLQEWDRKEAQSEIAKVIMEKIADLRSWYLAGAHGSPP